MSILVTGATGSIGKQIVKQLGEHGVKVKAMTSSNRKSMFNENVEMVQGNLDSIAPLLKRLIPFFYYYDQMILKKK